MTTTSTTAPTQEFNIRCQKVLGVARQLFQGSPDWVTFFREVLGVDGAARQVFPSQTEYVQFEKSGEYGEIQQMVTALRNRKGAGMAAQNEPTRVITVRLPESLHEALKLEANDHNTSMNKLCIAKLLQVLTETDQKAPATTVARTAAQPARPMQPVAAGHTTSSPAPSTGFRSTWSPSQSNGF